MSPIEVHDKVRGMNIVPRFPRVVFHSVSLPLDKIPQFPIDYPTYPTVQYLLNSPLLFSVNDLRRRRRLRTTTSDRIRDGWGQLDNIEDRMKAAHGRRKAEAISTVSDFLDDWKRA